VNARGIIHSWRCESLRWCPTPFTAASVNTRRTFNARVTTAIVSRARTRVRSRREYAISSPRSRVDARIAPRTPLPPPANGIKYPSGIFRDRETLAPPPQLRSRHTGCSPERITRLRSFNLADLFSKTCPTREREPRNDLCSRQTALGKLHFCSTFVVRNDTSRRVTETRSVFLLRTWTFATGKWHLSNSGIEKGKPRPIKLTPISLTASVQSGAGGAPPSQFPGFLLLLLLQRARWHAAFARCAGARRH